MKAVTPYPFIPEDPREGEALCELRHASVKSGIKAGHLGQLRKPCDHRLNALDFSGQVEWRIGD